MPGIITSLALAGALMASSSEVSAQDVEYCLVYHPTGEIEACYRHKSTCDSRASGQSNRSCIVRPINY